MLMTVAFFYGLPTKSEVLFSALFERTSPDLILATTLWGWVLFP